MADLQSRLDQVRKDKQLLEEEEKRIKKEINDKRIPLNVQPGQVYKIPGISSPKMVACFNTISWFGVGLTAVGSSFSGCFSSSVLKGTTTKPELRQILIDKNAEYLGTFVEVFERRN